MLWRRRDVRLDTERLALRPPAPHDFRAWSALRRGSAAFLQPWEPTWAPDHLARAAFGARVSWARRSIDAGTALPLFLFRRADDALLGAITLDNIRRGPSQSASTGYWIGAPFARQGFMREAVMAVVRHAFGPLDLSRVEAGCLPENAPSRKLLESCGYKYEGVAQAYLQINGRWRNHVLYANLRHDRRGRTDAG